MEKICRILYRNICFLTVLTGIISCRSHGLVKKSPSPEQKNRFVIGFSIDTFVIERWRRDCDIFIATANNLGADVIVQTAGNSAENQNRQIRYLIDKGVDVLVIVPKEADSLTDTLKIAKTRGIPVISYDRLIRNADISLYITIDSQRMGELMAESLVSRVPSGNYVCIYGPKEDNNMLMATKGVHAVLSRYSGIRLLSEYYTDNWNFDLAYHKMSELLDSGIRPDAVICGNDAVAESVLHALAEYRINNVAVSGQDADIAACQRIVEGTQLMTVYKPITVLAKQAAENAYAFAAYRTSFPEHEGKILSDRMNNGLLDVPVIRLDPVTVTKQNMDKIIIDSGFHTREEVYRTDIVKKQG